MEDRLDYMYQSEIRLKKAGTVATLLGLIIVLLGLFGLMLQNLQLRMREISIRRVLGASFRHVLALLSQEFAALFTLANLIAWPVAWGMMDAWLQGFAYRNGQTPWVYLLALAGIGSLMLVLIGWQSWKAAQQNPAEVLRNE